MWLEDPSHSHSDVGQLILDVGSFSSVLHLITHPLVSWTVFLHNIEVVGLQEDENGSCRNRLFWGRGKKRLGQSVS